MAIRPQDELREPVRQACERGGVVVIPTFAVGRAQLLLLLIARLKASGQIPDVPVYLDSPMAIDATELLLRCPSEHRLTSEELQALGRVASLIRTPDQSRKLDGIRHPAIILAASGNGHRRPSAASLQKVFAPEERNLILFAGFQAGGTRGAALVGGAETIRIHGESVAARPGGADGFRVGSCGCERADRLDAAYGYATTARFHHPRRGFGHISLRQKIQDQLGWAAEVPEYRDRIELG